LCIADLIGTLEGDGGREAGDTIGLFVTDPNDDRTAAGVLR
jgi:hypothetical protein